MARTFIALVIATLALIEGTARIAGWADLPVRHVDAITGYIPKPEQQGQYAGRDWHINQMSMISEQPYTPSRDAVIIAGDSVAFGINTVSQAQRLAEVAGQLSGRAVYGIADGSWGFANALNYFLSRKADLGDPGQIVFVLNSSDFAAPSSWRCESTHPTHRPWSHAWFALRRVWWPQCLSSPLHPVPPEKLASTYQRLLALYPDTRITLLLYPKRDEFAQSTHLTTLTQPFSAQPNTRIVDLVTAHRAGRIAWRSAFYTDDIHPDAAGTRELARFIARTLIEPKPLAVSHNGEIPHRHE
ncbi:hypothetical protein ACTSKR_09075 [Chitinibacteraceae bacterium HSL-7]